jgi:hypothetical protein
MGLVATVPGTAAQGRWKVGDSGLCYFDANDEGPDQCVHGRWKLAIEGDPSSCYFDGSDIGPDQCSDPRAAGPIIR